MVRIGYLVVKLSGSGKSGGDAGMKKQEALKIGLSFIQKAFLCER